MPLPISSRLGSYEIVGLLGAGGMGEVYRARDTKLNRDVAMKVVPDLFAADPDRLARFEREAHTLAALNHPHIAHVYGFEESGGVRALVMELVDGTDLSQRIARGRIPVDEAIGIARQVADALDAAHERGIVHRDLKPANIMLTPEGVVKVLDFGLAKASEPAGARTGDLMNSPTKTSPAMMTHAGIVLGTAAYMAPEQAAGKAVDKRADIWAFGCVLFEMLTGRSLYGRESLTETLAAVMRDSPALDALPAATPLQVKRMIAHCLERDPKRRLRDIGDARFDANEELESSAAGTRWRARLLIAVASLVVLVAAGLAVWKWSKPEPTRQVVQLTIAPPHDVSLSSMGLAFAPDGSSVVFPAIESGTALLYRRSFDELQPTVIRGSDGAEFPFFSPDGKWLGFVASDRNVIRKVPIEGGPASTLVRTDGFRRGATWGPNNTILFATDKSPDLLSIRDGDTAATVFVPGTLYPGASLRWPSWPYQGTAVLFTIWTGDLESARIGAYDIRSGQSRAIIEGTAGLRLPTGDLLFARGGSLWTVPMDWSRLTATAAPIQVREGVQIHIGGAGIYSVAQNGSLAYVPGNAGNNRTVVWMNRKGERQPLLEKVQMYANPTLSPDGRRVAVQVAQTDAEEDIWIYDIQTNVPTRLTFGGGRHSNPVWTPDGRRIVYAFGKDLVRNLYWIAADGTGDREQLSTTPRVQIPSDVSPDGHTLIFAQGNDVGDPSRRRSALELWTMSLNGERTPHRFLQSTFEGSHARFSPDGRWVAYVSTESGITEVYVRPFPGPGGTRQISAGGGFAPEWSRDGSELFFLSDGMMKVADVQLGTSFIHGVPRLLFPYNAPADFTITPNAERFLMVFGEGSNNDAVVVATLNWTEELKRRSAKMQ